MKRALSLFAVLGVALTVTAVPQEMCELNYAACVNDCRAPGPPSPGCMSACKAAELKCTYAGECTPFCPP